MTLLPCDPTRSHRVDEHFAAEAEAAQAAGLAVALVDHDELQTSGATADAVRRVPSTADAVYRGWMISSEQYAAFDQALRLRRATLRTTPEQYRRAHELPGWHEQLAAVTPESCWTVGDDLDALDECRRQLASGPAVLRDYTKSMKHYWLEAAYVPDVADQAATRRVAQRFRELRDDAFTGGYVLRRFETFVGAEARTWWVDGRCVLTTAHPDTPDEQPLVPTGLLHALDELVAGLDLRFVTLDLVEREDGAWRVVELGDGQVSDRPASCPAAMLMAALTGGPPVSADTG